MPNNLSRRQIMKVVGGLVTGAACSKSVDGSDIISPATAQVKELEKLNALKDDFLCSVSHELRTPMSNMKMAISMLKNSPTVERSQRLLEILQDECNRESALINDLLDLQRLETAPNPSQQFETLYLKELKEMLTRTIESFRDQMLQSQQTFRLNLPPDLPPLLCDHVSLERILAELLNNACKYTDFGGEIGLSICYKSAEVATRFTVSNSAEIPADELPHIFDKFYRVLNTDPRKQGGIGLRLALVQKLVEQLQGTISAESSRGWTTFTVSLPNQPIV